MTDTQYPAERSTIRSLRSYDPASNSSSFASVSQFAALLNADLVSPAPARTGGGNPWTVELGVAELVGILRCLDELAAVYPGSALADVVGRYSTELRQRVEQARVAPPVNERTA